MFRKDFISFKPGPTASRSGPTRENELVRIRTDLRQFLDASEVGSIIAKINGVSIETDREIAAILRDPRCLASYGYDGRIFTSRREPLFHTAFDGLRLLEWLNTTVLKALFLPSGKQRGLERLLEEIEKIHWVAMTRRRNWEEFGTLGLVGDGVIQGALDECHMRATSERDPAPLSEEEIRFFRTLGV